VVYFLGKSQKLPEAISHIKDELQPAFLKTIMPGDY
jgi:hypothetical protein